MFYVVDAVCIARLAGVPAGQGYQSCSAPELIMMLGLAPPHLFMQKRRTPACQHH